MIPPEPHFIRMTGKRLRERCAEVLATHRQWPYARHAVGPQDLDACEEFLAEAEAAPATFEQQARIFAAQVRTRKLALADLPRDFHREVCRLLEIPMPLPFHAEPEPEADWL